jgi:hypothetical protein
MGPVTHLLALADEVDDSLYGAHFPSLRPDLVVACGDLPFDYLEYVVTITNVPLLFVPGNHDPALGRRAADGLMPLTRFAPRYAEDEPRPWGCINIDGRIARAGGVTVAGLGGSIRYSEGPNQYTEAQMRRRAFLLEARRIRSRPGRRAIDVVVAHSPPAGLGDGTDPAHRGIDALNWLIRRWSPRMLLHGHVHPYGGRCADRRVGATTVVNAIPYRLLEVDA